MTIDWPHERLGDHIDLLAGFAFKSQDFTNGSDDIRLLRGANVAQGFLKWGQERRLPRSMALEYRKFDLEAGDIVLAMDRPWIEAGLKWSSIREADLPMLLVQRVARLRAAGSISQNYLRYLIGSPQFEAYVRPIVTGVNIPHISPKQIRNFAFKLPSADVQSSVARLLGPLDLLLESNRRRIEILEDIARLIYQEWFMHFRFPGHEAVEFIDSELGPIPDGWRLGEFGDLVSEERQTVSPDEIPDGAPVIGLEHLPRRSTTLRTWECAANVGSRRKIFEEGDILFGKIRPYFHKVVNAPFLGYVTPSALIFRPKSEIVRARALSVASSDDFIHLATSTSNGTTMPSANAEILMSYRVLHPTPSVEQAFHEVVGPMDSLRKTLVEQLRCVSLAKDLLLPRLVSGELDVSDLDLELEVSGV